MNRFQPTRRNWSTRFGDALTGSVWGMKQQPSFVVHAAFTVAVVVLGIVLRLLLIEWCVILLCCALVLSLEMMNSALERLAKAITDQTNEDVRIALNIASASVLLAATGAALIGSLVFIQRMWVLWSNTSAIS
jgi:diacylglycerol kinase